MYVNEGELPTCRLRMLIWLSLVQHWCWLFAPPSSMRPLRSKFEVDTEHSEQSGNSSPGFKAGRRHSPGSLCWPASPTSAPTPSYRSLSSTTQASTSSSGR